MANKNIEKLDSSDTENDSNVNEGESSGCFGIVSDLIEPMTPSDHEFDESLAIPDAITVYSLTDHPVLVESVKKGEIERTDGGTTTTVLPYLSIHDPPLKFKSFQRKIFIPNVEIKVRIVNNERSVTSHMLNPNLYTIRFDHGDFTWYVKKRYKHIHQLHQQLCIYRASLNIPFPTKTHKERRCSFKNNLNPALGKKKSSLPRFPNRPEALVPYEHIDDRIQQLEKYLYNLLNVNVYRNHPDTVDFLQVSHLSFVDGLGIKGKEGEVLKRTGSTQPGQAGCNFCGLLESAVCVRCNYFWSDVMCGAWRKRWFFVKETCFGYVRPKDGFLKCVILFDQGFEVSSGMYSTGLSNGLLIQTLSRQLIIKCWTRRKSKDWMQSLRDTAHTTAKDFTQPNEHASFVPSRMNIRASWFVDGSSFMSTVADALEAAKEEIFIAAWWLTPEIYLKRPVLNGDYWRLDNILKRKADQGVKVFILLYKEVGIAIDLNSYCTKQKLMQLSNNIKVLRHPDHAKAGILFWAHHEKIIAVDQNIAFVGGLDLCFSRWDDSRHRLTDLGSAYQTAVPGKRKITSSTPGRATAYVQSTVPTVSQVNLPYIEEESNIPSSSATPIFEAIDPENSLYSRNTTECNTPEMERKNPLDVLKTNVKAKTKDFIHKIAAFNDSDDEDKKNSNKNELKPLDNKPDILSLKHAEIADLTGSAKLWIGKDYANAIVKDLANLDIPYVDIIDRNTTPRMPWHDIGAMVLGPSARDASRHFIQRWNDCKLEKARINSAYPYLLPKSYSYFEKVGANINDMCFNVTCQVLRSVSSWSCGFLECDTVEQSIHEALIDTINRAQHYIYIENQFFITLAMESVNVRNLVGEALCKRIKRAHRENKKFRVYVVMPLLPGFEGEIGTSTAASILAITHWNYASINRGKDSLLVRLKELGIENPDDYISFYSLRTHAKLHDEPISELIYVHSKLIIVDDYLVISGSANINDRSLLGKRDSEVAVLIKDEEYESGTMNGETFPSGKYAGSLRKHLFKEHLGLLGDLRDDIDITDPVIDEFYFNVWKKTADKNTEIFEKVFHCIPTDSVDSYVNLKIYQEETPLSTSDPNKAREMVKDIQGHLVNFPLNFLNNEVLTPTSASVEGIMPMSIWT